MWRPSKGLWRRSSGGFQKKPSRGASKHGRRGWTSVWDCETPILKETSCDFNIFFGIKFLWSQSRYFLDGPLMSLQVAHNMVTNVVFEFFACNTGKWNRTVIFRIAPVSFFQNRYDVNMKPFNWETSWGKGFLKDPYKNMGNSWCTSFQNLCRDFVQTRRFVWLHVMSEFFHSCDWYTVACKSIHPSPKFSHFDAPWAYFMMLSNQT